MIKLGVGFRVCLPLLIFVQTEAKEEGKEVSSGEGKKKPLWKNHLRSLAQGATKSGVRRIFQVDLDWKKLSLLMYSTTRQFSSVPVSFLSWKLMGAFQPFLPCGWPSHTVYSQIRVQRDCPSGNYTTFLFKCSVKIKCSC